MTSQNSERDFIFKELEGVALVNCFRHNSSTRSYYGSQENDHHKEILLTPSMSAKKSHPLATYVMTTRATFIEEQLAHFTKLTRTVEEKDMQTATLMSRLESQHDREVHLNPYKNWHDEESGEEEARHVNEAGGRQKQESEATSTGSFSVQKLKDMIINNISAVRRHFVGCTDVLQAIH